jgi:hypothetical protein
MRNRNRGHWTTTDAQFVRKAVGKAEAKLRNGKWVKITGDTVVHGASRTEVREAAKA